MNLDVEANCLCDICGMMGFIISPVDNQRGDRQATPWRLGSVITGYLHNHVILRIGAIDIRIHVMLLSI